MAKRKNDLREVGLIKGNEFYRIVYDAQGADLALKYIYQMASDKDSGLDWFDASVLSHIITSGLETKFKGNRRKI